MNLDILKGNNGANGDGKAPDAGATPVIPGRGLDSVNPIPPSGRGGARPGSGRKPKGAIVGNVPMGPPPELFKPEDILPVVELPFKLAAVALRSDAVDLEEDEKARLGRTGANAANHWIEISPKAFTGVIFLTTLTQVLLAKVILFKAEQRDRQEALEKANAQLSKAS